MKKIKYLCGLLGLFSAISFQSKADIDVNTVIKEEAKEETLLFAPSQAGGIPVKGKLVTPLTDIGFVIYSAPKGTETSAIKNGVGINNELELPDFTLIVSSDKTVQSGFVSNPNSIFVKRLENDEIVDLEPNDKIDFRVKLDQEYGEIAEKQPWLVTGNTITMWPLVFLKKSTLEDIAKQYCEKVSSKPNQYGGDLTPGLTFDLTNTWRGAPAQAANATYCAAIFGTASKGNNPVYIPNSSIHISAQNKGELAFSAVGTYLGGTYAYDGYQYTYDSNSWGYSYTDNPLVESLFSKAKDMEFSVQVRLR